MPIRRWPLVTRNFGDASMARSRRYHPLVAEDLSKATVYYDAISSDLGNRFRSCVRACLLDVTSRPASFGVVDGPVRAALLEHFPYVVLFEDWGSIVLILGIHHAASDPTSWRR
jgi:hypothetical protein